VRFGRLISLAVVASVGLTGCGGIDSSDSQAQQTKPKRTAPSAPMAAAAEAAPEYHYDPAGKPDPFRSYIKELGRLRSASTATPLERFDLSQIAVSAVIWGNKKPRALIHDPSGKGYIVSVGTPVGKNDGRITEIGDGRVLVKETYVDYEGQATTKDVELRLVGR
jgi:type IV pilus assembly protein PilP